MEQVILTQVGFDKLKKEHNDLLKKDVPALIEEIKKAKSDSNCPITENSEFIEASTALDRVETKIQTLEEKIRKARIVDINQIKDDGKVKFGCTVKLLRLDDDKEITFQVVGAEESDVKSGLISYLSPLAREMMGLEEGDIVLCADIEYEILDVFIVR